MRRNIFCSCQTPKDMIIFSRKLLETRQHISPFCFRCSNKPNNELRAPHFAKRNVCHSHANPNIHQTDIYVMLNAEQLPAFLGDDLWSI